MPISPFLLRNTSSAYTEVHLGHAEGAPKQLLDSKLGLSSWKTGVFFVEKTQSR